MVNDESSPDNGHIKIINTNGDVISDVEKERVGENIKSQPYVRNIVNSTASEGYLSESIGGEKQLISFYKSDYNNWIYLGVFQADSLLSRINGIRTFILVLCSALILVGITTSYFASRKIYNPLHNLLHDIRQKKGIDIKSSDSEMFILAKAYNNLLKDRDRLSRIQEHKEDNKTVYLETLLKGKKVEYLDRELTGIDLPCRHFICSVIQIDRYGVFESAYTKEQQEYMRMFILKISEELLDSRWKCAGTVYGKNRIVLIVNYDEPPSGDLRDALKTVFEKIQAEIGKITDNTVSVGIGTCQEGMEGICESFDRALEALHYKLISGFGSVNFWKEPCKENSRYYYPFVQEKHLFNILNAGMTEKLGPAITEFVQEIKSNREIHYDNITHVFDQLIGNTVKHLLDCQCNISMIFGDGYNLYTEMASKENLDEIREWLIEVFSRIADYQEKKWSLSKNHFERALEYIHKNYRHEIDINEVARYAGISYSHLRKVFREEAGENILNYINGLRIQESKRLLRMTDMMIKDISAVVGYNCEKSFVRFFKKYEGVAPREFRASVK
jgi:AraC-like DNA-binding protein